MAVYRRGGHWHFTKTVDGIRYRQALKTARTKLQAEEAERTILNEIHTGTYNKPKSNKTFKDFVQGTYTELAMERKSWPSDQSRLKPLLEYFGKKTLKEIIDNPFLIEKFKMLRLKTPVIRTNKKKEVTTQKDRSKSSVNRELQLLSSIFGQAVRKKEATSNPVSMDMLFKNEKRRKRRLLPDERNRLFEAFFAPQAQGKREHLAQIVILDLNTGLRRTELLSLTVSDVDFVQNTLTVRNTKNGEDREIEMNKTARELLLKMIEQARANDWKFVFTNPRTGTRYKDVKKAFNAACRDAGITDFRLHDLRHSFASTAGDNPDVSIAALAEVLGHKDWKTTMRYTHASKASKLRVVESQERAS